MGNQIAIAVVIAGLVFGTRIAAKGVAYSIHRTKAAAVQLWHKVHKPADVLVPQPSEGSR